MASGLSLKSYGPPPHHYHPITFRGSEWEYMVQIEASSTPRCREGVQSQGGKQEEHRVELHIQVEHYQKKFQDHESKSKIPGLIPVDYESGLLFHFNIITNKAMAICPRHMLLDKVSSKYFWKCLSEKDLVSKIVHKIYF